MHGILCIIYICLVGSPDLYVHVFMVLRGPVYGSRFTVMACESHVTTRRFVCSHAHAL